MELEVSKKSHKILTLNTIAFTVCFAAWMFNGVLIVFLSSNSVYNWSATEIGWLIGIPVLTGSLFRLPLGILTDKFGGKFVFGFLLIFCAIPMYLVGMADSFLGFALCGLGFGMSGTSFAVGIAFTSVWYPKKWQGTALGIFGAGNAGAALTTYFAPKLLNSLTNNGANLEGWRELPAYYAIMLLIMGLLFLFFAENKKPASSNKTIRKMLVPLKNVRVWRFGVYYFLVFGCFVALAGWLVNYYLNNYEISLATAGLFATLFALPGGVIRALGGWLSDKFGARRVMYWVLFTSTACSVFLFFPKMEVITAGPGIIAKTPGIVQSITASEIVVGSTTYPVNSIKKEIKTGDGDILLLPSKTVWQEVIVKVGDKVNRKQTIAKGKTKIFFQANIYIATVIIVLLGVVWGIGKAAVYKHIPEYFPEEVGVVGGLVGVLGGLGGFISPIIFGYLLNFTGLWTSMWFYLAAISLFCLIWMHRVIKNMLDEETPHLNDHFEHKNA
jgi:MFS transporter, NNP family, nitrate/nitrite transporter